ncbi:MAG: DUF433 domain-containing protein [Tildeniella nuda ZEHNDER 1965/U140]|jgi:uncharacterized protein (DUF433 family)|nr:DUF433 domain-containing protein [Tildeniella nuda ZEHNDER 1965/U140]
MEIAPHISVDSAIHHGTPVITGTRVPIAIILGSLAGGMSKEAVMQEYELTQTQVEAALIYSTNILKRQRHKFRRSSISSFKKSSDRSLNAGKAF